MSPVISYWLEVMRFIYREARKELELQLRYKLSPVSDSKTVQYISIRGI